LKLGPDLDLDPEAAMNTGPGGVSLYMYKHLIGSAYWLPFKVSSKLSP